MIKQRRTLQRGDTGDDVKFLQACLGIPWTGHFDPLTEKTVEAFQDVSGLKIDGIVGPKTWKALEEKSGLAS